jgi:high affinity Mn2+ porin
MRRSISPALLLVLVPCLGTMSVHAQTSFSTASEQPNDTPAWLARAFRPEDWATNFQATYVWQKHDSFHAEYDGPHSLSSKTESGYTLTSTLYLGHRLWQDAGIFFNPEVIQSRDLSDLHGLGGLSNGENQKTGGPTAKLYSARLFIRQSINLGDRDQLTEAGTNQFPDSVAAHRIVVTAGQMALIDVFDNNAFAHDARIQFFNWALMAQGASDYAADARGYTWGLAVEYYRRAWAFRWGHFAQPKESNGLALDFRLWSHFGENFEVEHGHVLWGQSGKVRLMTFLNYARMGGFRDAIAFAPGGQPDVANFRRDRAKLGFGINVEQSLGPDLGAFARFSWNDGRTETYAFAEIDRSFTVGAVAHGRHWLRPADSAGVAYVLDAISSDHRDYLAAGGLGNFIGDVRLSYSPEQVLEVYYSLRAFSGLWFSLDGQYVFNPAYNADRGRVAIGGLRVHAEY